MFFKKKYGIKDILDLMSTADSRAYYGFHDESINILADDIKIEFDGTIIEPIWELFEGACIVKVNDEIVYGEDSRNVEPYHNEKYTYGKYGSREETAQALMKILENKDCIVDTGREKIKCVFMPDKQEEKNETNNIEIPCEDDMEM